LPDPIGIAGVGDIHSREAFGDLQVGLAIYPGSVASVEAFGTAQVDQSITSTGIASVEAFGTAQVDQSVTSSGIASVEAFGTLIVSTGSVSVSPSGIASVEAFGTAQVGQGITPSGIASTEVFGTAQANLMVNPSSITSAEAFGSLSVGYDQIVSPSSITSDEEFGTASVSAIYCHESLHNAIRAHFDDNTSVVTIYDNMTTEPPDNALWVRFTVSTSFSEQTSFGSRIHLRKYGDATASIHAPAELGDGDVLAMVDTVRGLFRDATIGSAVFLQPNVERIGLEQRWWRVDVVCPFYYDDSKALPEFTQSPGSPDVEATHNTIRSHFKAEVADVLAVDVQYDNAELDPPDNSTWVRLSILDGDSVRTARNSYRTTGVIDAAVFTPLGAGDQAALSVADRIVNAFLPSTVSGVKFRIPSVSSIGRSGRWWQVTVSCPFQVNETS